jgi:hypothetical protein
MWIDSRQSLPTNIDEINNLFHSAHVMFAILLLHAGCGDVAQSGVYAMRLVSLTDNLGETKLNEHFAHSA